MQILTYTPFRTNLLLKTGISPGTTQFTTIVDKLKSNLAYESAVIPNAQEQRKAYENLIGDGYDLRLVVWQSEQENEDDPIVRFHIYGNAIAIAEVSFLKLPEQHTDYEAWSQQQTERALEAVFDQFLAFVKSVRKNISSEFIENKNAKKSRSFSVNRTSRALIIPENERKARAALISDWLKSTIRPDDADDINSGKLLHSMTWVNYVVINKPVSQANDYPETLSEDTKLCIASMRIAQYFWSAQEWFNKEMQQIVASALNENTVKTAERNLITGRARMQMMKVEYNALRSVLSRPKEKLLREILQSWSFDSLIENGERLIELSTSRIAEITSKRVERSSLFTDLILVGIGFIAIMEVLINLMGFSREMMSRPALEYNDNNISFLMSLFASIDTDWTLMSGFTIILVLLGVYLVLKKSQ